MGWRAARGWLGCLAVAGLLFAASCDRTEDATPDGRLRVVTTLFPLYDFARQIGGGNVAITLLLPPGTEPHAFDPTPRDIDRIRDADVFIYTGPHMEPWAEDLIAGIDAGDLHVVNASAGLTLLDTHKMLGEAAHEHEHAHDHDHDHDHEHVHDHGRHHDHGGGDPHVWLDFDYARQMVRSIAEAFAQADPGRAEAYRRNAEDYCRRLESLDEEYRRTLADCRRRSIVHGGHFAFGYMARRYGLEVLSPFEGFSPQAEPSVRRIEEITGEIQQRGIEHVFHEQLVEPRVARALAEHAGCELLELHTAGNVSKEDLRNGVTYLELMRRNLQALRKGLGCR
jgi:zinc transport system substrate-binding protein